MNVLVCLAAILLLLMVWIGGKKGFRSFLALFFNFGVVLLSVFFMNIPSFNPVIVTLIACAAISCITLFYINSVNKTSIAAFLSTVVTIVLMLFFIDLVTKYAGLQGFGKEEMEELGSFSLYLGVDFVKIGASVIIMSAIGAITDTAMAIASPMREMAIHHKTISQKELFFFGIKIGKDILGTSANTLFFAFFGGYLALLIFFKNLAYSAEEVLNSKIFAAEIITIFCSGIGVGLVIPITAWISSYYYLKVDKNNSVINDEQ